MPTMNLVLDVHLEIILANRLYTADRNCRFLVLVCNNGSLLFTEYCMDTLPGGHSPLELSFLVMMSPSESTKNNGTIAIPNYIIILSSCGAVLIIIVFIFRARSTSSCLYFSTRSCCPSVYKWGFFADLRDRNNLQFWCKFLYSISVPS